MAEYKKALVTGGAGFIGSNLTKKLLEMGLDVYVLDNLTTGDTKNVPPEANLIRGDLLDPELVKQVIDEGIEIVFHNAAKVTIRGSVDNFYEDGRNNVLGTLNLLRNCKSSKVRKIIFASSMAVYGDSEKAVPLSEDYKKDPLSPYGISKLASEMYIETLCKALGLQYIILRYFNTYGPGQTFTPYVGVITIFINRLLRGEPPVIFGDGMQCRDFVYVDDIVQGNIRAMETKIDSGIFNLGSGRGHTVNDVARILIDKLDNKIKASYSVRRSEELTNSIADISMSRNILKYSPEYKFPDNIEKVIEAINSS